MMRAVLTLAALSFLACGRKESPSPDASLAGTTLDGIALEWSEELVLCAGGQVQVHLPINARSGLGRDELSAASLMGGRVDRGPFFADQFPIRETDSALTKWDLVEISGATTLDAEIAHDVGGVGTLLELISVSRESGDRSPVRYDDSEARFILQTSARERFELSACGGPSNVEASIFVMAATRGEEWVTVLREQRASIPIKAEAMLSKSLERFQAEGPWTQIYDASIRFDRDPRWSYQVYAALLLQEIELLPGRLEVTSVEVASSAVTTESFEVEGGWTRVDDAQLAREMSCAAPRMTAIEGLTDDGLFLLQLGYCGASHLDLELVVPIYFPPEPRLAGRRFDSGSIVPITVGDDPAVQVDLGTGYLQLTEDRLLMLDAERNLVSESLFRETELLEERGLGEQEVSGANLEAGVSSKLRRVWVSVGNGKSSIFAPLSFELTFGGETHRVDAWDKLVYTNTMHNWNDALICDDGVVQMFWSVVFPGEGHQVRAVRIADGVEVLPLTTLTDVP